MAWPATRSSLSRPAEVRTGWYAWALPSAQLAALALVGILYGLVPEGRWRQTGKWVATALVILIAFAHLYLGWRHPPTCWSGWRSGWPFRCSASACSAPSQVFPITYTYRRRRSAHGGRPSMAAAQADAEPTP